MGEGNVMSRTVSNWWLTGLLAATVLVAGSGQRSSAEDSAEVLARVTAAHRAARESIRTLQTRFTLTIERAHPKSVSMTSGTYLRSPDGVLLRVGQEGKATGDTLVKGGETRTVGRNWSPGNKIAYLASRQPGSHILGPSDAWQRLLLSTYGPDRQTMPFERFIETASGPVRASTAREGGREIVTVTLSVVGSQKQQIEHRIEFDAGVNYLVRKLVVTTPGVDERSEAEIEQFIEAQPGVFVPVKCRARSYKGSSLDSGYLLALSDTVVNAPVPPERLALPTVPSGTVLTDMVHQTKYPIDSNWNRIGPAKPAPMMKVGSPASESTRSDSEPFSTSRLILLVSTLVLLMAGAAWGICRWRRREATA
jgi:hypothetical protein